MGRDVATALFGAFFLALSAFLWWEGSRQSFTVLGTGIAYDPLFFPRFLLGLGGICAAGILALGLAARRTARAEPRWGLWFGIVLVVAAYFWAMAQIGFPTATVLFVAAFCALLGYRRWLAVALAAFGMTAGVWYVFTAWLHVPLPVSPWLEGLF